MTPRGRGASLRQLKSCWLEKGCWLRPSSPHRPLIKSERVRCGDGGFGSSKKRLLAGSQPLAGLDRTAPPPRGVGWGRRKKNPASPRSISAFIFAACWNTSMNALTLQLRSQSAATSYLKKTIVRYKYRIPPPVRRKGRRQRVGWRPCNSMQTARDSAGAMPFLFLSFVQAC